MLPAQVEPGSIMGLLEPSAATSGRACWPYAPAWETAARESIIRCKCTLFWCSPQLCIWEAQETLIIRNCNFCYQSNTDQKGSLSPPLTCETSQLYSLEMTGALNSRAEQMTTINHVWITMSHGPENYFCIESTQEFMKGGKQPKVLGHYGLS